MCAKAAFSRTCQSHSWPFFRRRTDTGRRTRFTKFAQCAADGGTGFLLQSKAGDKTTPGAPLFQDAHITRLHDKLQERFGTKVTVRYQKGKGAIEIKFFNDEDLERILNVAGIPPESLLIFKQHPQ